MIGDMALLTRFNRAVRTAWFWFPVVPLLIYALYVLVLLEATLLRYWPPLAMIPPMAFGALVVRLTAQWLNRRDDPDRFRSRRAFLRASAQPTRFARFLRTLWTSLPVVAWLIFALYVGLLLEVTLYHCWPPLSALPPAMMLGAAVVGFSARRLDRRSRLLRPAQLDLVAQADDRLVPRQRL